MKNLYSKIHTYFSKNNFRLLSLLGIAFALVVTIVLVQQQQDLRQRAEEIPINSGCAVGQPNYPATFCCGQKLCLKLAGDSKAYCDPPTPGTKCYGNTNSGSESGGSGSKDSGSTGGTSNNNGSGINATMTCSSVNVSWPAVTNASTYKVDIYEDPSKAALPSGTTGGTNLSLSPPNGFKEGHIYYVYVLAKNSSGGTVKTSSTTVTAPSTCSGSGSNNTGGGTGVLGSFSISNVSMQCNSASVKWTASSNATSYKVDIYDDPSKAPVGSKTTSQTSTTVAPTSGTFRAGVIHYVYVTAKNSSGTKRASTTGLVPSTCTGETGGGGTGGSTSTPGAFTFSTPTMTCNSAQLSWGASANATGYIVKVYEGGPTGPVVQESGRLTQRSYTVTGLKQGTIHTFTVTAVNNGTGIKTMSQTKSTSSSCSTGGGGNNPSPPATTSVPTGQVSITSTPTGSGNTVTISISFTLPGIGAQSQFKNPNPNRKQRMINVGLINSSSAITSAQGTANFESSTYVYKGTVPVSNLAPGAYTAKIRLDNTLWKNLPDTITISSGTNNPSTTTVQLISGDLDQNNRLTIDDYTDFVKCYKGLPSCSTSMRSLANFDEDATAKGDLDDLTILQQGFNSQTQGD